jgi:hypothetical protein
MEPMLEAVVSWRDDKNEAKAKQIWSSGLTELHQSVSGGEKYGYRLHSAYKVCTWLRGLIPDPFLRPPQRKLPLYEVLELRDLLKKVGLEVIGDREIKRAYPQT